MVDSTKLPEIDINAIVTDLNNKMDRDCLNVSETGKVQMSGMGMPGDRYIDFTFPANGAVLTAPANGWYNLIRRVGSGSDTEKYLIGKTSTGLRIIECGGASWQELCLLIPVKKGDTVTMEYNATGDIMRSRFVYAAGSEPQN